MYEASQNGGTCIDPLFYYYPNDENAYIDNTFMVAGALKVTPILAATNDDTVQTYFPNGTWLDLHTLQLIDATNGSLVNISTK